MDFCAGESFITECIRITCGDSEIGARKLIRSLARTNNRRGPTCGRRQIRTEASKLAGKKLEKRRNSVRVEERHHPGNSRDDGYNKRGSCERPSASVDCDLPVVARGPFYPRGSALPRSIWRRSARLRSARLCLMVEPRLRDPRPVAAEDLCI